MRKGMRKSSLSPFLFLLLLLAGNADAETYTGRAEDLKATDRGVEFVIIVEDSKGSEVYRRDYSVSTGMRTAAQAKEAIKNLVDKITQEIYAHIEGAKAVMKSKEEIEKYRASCSSFTAPELKPKLRGRGNNDSNEKK